MSVPTYSIKSHFDGSTVLLTGASGYIGSLVLEKLLRTTRPRRIYILVRSKHGHCPSSRLVKLFKSSPVFHLIRSQESRLSLATPVAGDVLQPRLGLSQEDFELLQSEVDIILHCAADIRLEIPIQGTLRTNYKGTEAMLELASGVQNLRAFVHVSTAYTNFNQPSGATILEKIYPLHYGNQPLNGQQLVEELLRAPGWQADLRARALLTSFSFPNTYSLGKHLAEYLVADYQQRYGLPIAVVRPTLVGSVARDPYPGYAGNFAGPVGATLAFSLGFISSPETCAWKSTNVMDTVPADVVANVILATAAALGAGVAGSCVADEREPRTGPTLQSNVCANTPSPSAADKSTDRDSPHQQAALAPPTDDAAAGTSAGAACRPPADVAAATASTSAAAEAAHGSVQKMLIVHAGTSTTYPVTLMEFWNILLMTLSAWPKPYRLSLKMPQPMTAEAEFDPLKAQRNARLLVWKIWVVSKLLGLCGHKRLARKVEAGYASFLITNTPDLDQNHRFSTTQLRRLAAALHPSEQAEYMLVFEPGNGSTTCPSPKDMARLSSSSSTMDEKVQYMHSVPCDLGTQTLNLTAFLWRRLFGLEVPYETEVTSEAIKGQLGFKKDQEVVLRHCFYYFG